MRLLRSRRAVASVVAALLSIILLSMFAAGLVLVTKLQNQSVPEAVQTSEEISQTVKESLEASIDWVTGNKVHIRVKNTGSVTARIGEVLAAKRDGSLQIIKIDPPETLIPREERVFPATIFGGYSRLGLLTDRGKIYVVDTGPPSQPQSFDFTVSVNPHGGSVQQGGSVSAAVNVELVSDPTQPVTLSASGLPSGASYSFNPSSGTPSFTSTIKVSTSTSTPTGRYIITITGTGGGLTRTSTYTLNITQRPSSTATVTFSANGLETDASSNVLMVDRTGYPYSQLPISFSWRVGSSHSFEWLTPISAGSTKRYVWTSTSGLSTSRSGAITVPSGGGSVTANFKTQYQWSFSASGLGDDTSGTVMTVDGSSYRYSSLPAVFWWDRDSSHSYAYQEYVSTRNNGKRYALHSPPSSVVTVKSSDSRSPSYHAEYMLTVQVNPSGSGSTSPAPGTYWYDTGSSVSVTASPNANYAFDRWVLDRSNVGSSNPITVTMNASHILEAKFTGASYTLEVRVLRDGADTGIQGVTVKIDDSPYTTGPSGKVSVSVSYGSHTIRVVSPYSPSIGTRYAFTAWSDGSTGNPRDVLVTGAISLTAYMELQYYLTMQVNPSGGGSVSPNSGWYDAGSSMSISATPASGSKFNGWSGSGSGSYTGPNNPATITVNGPITETANFIQVYTVTFTQTGLPSGTSWSATFGGDAKSSTGSTITFTVSSGTYAWSVSTPISGGPGVRYVASPASGRMDVPSKKSQSITYMTEYQLTISVTPSGTGTTIPAPGSYWYSAGSTASVSASPLSSVKVSVSASEWPSGTSGSFSPSSGTPTLTSTLTVNAGSSTTPGTYTITVSGSKSGYKLSGWKCDGSYAGTSNPVSITMDAPHSLVAEFAQPSIQLSVNPSSISILQGGSGALTVTVTESITEKLSIAFTLTVQPVHEVRVYTKDVEGYAVSGVKISLKGSKGSFSGYTNSYGYISFQVPAGTYTLSVPSITTAFGYNVGYYRWSDGSTSRSRTITVFGDASYTAIYKTALKLKKHVVGKAGLDGPGWFVASGWVESSHGNPVEEASVHATFHLYSWLFGRKTLSASATSSSYAGAYGAGWFSCSVWSPLDALIYEVEYADVYASKKGYEPVSAKWYP